MMAMTPVSVDCIFDEDGLVQVRRVKINGRWRQVEQGRQWLDGSGRSVLIMLPGGGVHTLVLRPATMRWELHTRTSGQTAV